MAQRRPDRGTPSLAAFAQHIRNHGTCVRHGATRTTVINTGSTMETLAGNSHNCVAHNVVDKLVPMANETLSALSWQLILLGCSASHIGQAWGAIAHRHAVARVPTPLAGKGDYAKWRKSLGVMQGQPSPLKFPIRKEHLWALLALPGLATAPFVFQRNVLGTALTVVCCARVSEMAELQ